MDKAADLGIGSRVRHPDYGLGVVVNVKGIYYQITFVEEGKKGHLTKVKCPFFCKKILRS